MNDMIDMIEAEIWTIVQTEQGNAVLLRPFGAETVIPIFIGPLEAQSILIGFDHIQVERPMTHDLLLALMEEAGFTLLKIEVWDLKENIFYGRLCFSGGKSGHTAAEPFVLDARPSDALALAVRTHCPILVARKVLDLAGIPADIIADSQEIPLKREPRETLGDVIQGLKQELEKAVASEEYERAAEIRDKLNRLTKEREKPV
jgi:bifunctional DNase/RNase